MRVDLRVLRPSKNNFLKRHIYQQYYLFANIYYIELIICLKISLGILQL